MALPRIKIAKDKAELIQKLIDSKDGTGPFQTYADVVAFAASLGISDRQRVPLQEISNSEPAPISLEVFISRGYDWVIKLIAFTETPELSILDRQNREIEAERIKIFEEYANGGLEKLKDELRGAVDYTERLLLILSAERFKEESTEEEFDLSKFL